VKALVTGASGFIGYSLSKALLRQGWEVWGLDSHSDYYSVQIKEVRRDELLRESLYRFSKVDIADIQNLNKILLEFRPDSVFHFAAQAGVRIPVAHLDRYAHSNLNGFSAVLQSTIMNEIPNFIYASSSSVYGSQAKVPYSESELYLLPNSFYGATKLANEILVKSIVQNTATKARGIRLFSVYGPKGRPDMAYYRIIFSILKNEHFKLYGDGEIKRDFTFINDVVDIVTKLDEDLLNRACGFNDIVNIGGGNPISINDLIRECSDYLGKKLKIDSYPADESDSKVTNASFDYVYSLVGSYPSTKVSEGLAETIQWAKESDQELWGNLN
jgi:UDP-glucuronate 4-epimerase